MQPEAKIKIIIVSRAAEFELADGLIREYIKWRDIDVSSQNFALGTSHLETTFAPPNGALLLALFNGQPIGGVAVGQLEDEICEIKWLYVKPDFQGGGIGRELIWACVEKARELDYERIWLDVRPDLERARTLFASAGFNKISAYRHRPDPNTVFMELKLKCEK